MDRLAVSNIAWTGCDAQLFSKLGDAGVRGIEVAPCKIASWDSLSTRVVKDYRQVCESAGLCIPSFQGFLFGLPELQLFGNKDVFQKLREHVQRVAELAEICNATVMVLGAPSNRLLLGNDRESAFTLAVDRLGVLSEDCWAHGVSLGLEPIPEMYGGEFVHHYSEAIAMVKEVSNPGLVFHMDTACVYLANDNVALSIENSDKFIRHCHISQPQLADFSAPETYHLEASQALRKIAYDGWRCIEMKETPAGIDAVFEAVEFVSKTYSLD